MKYGIVFATNVVMMTALFFVGVQLPIIESKVENSLCLYPIIYVKALLVSIFVKHATKHTIVKKTLILEINNSVSIPADIM